MFFRTPLTGDEVYMQRPDLSVIHIGPYQGAIAEATGGWGTDGIRTVEVSADVASWLLSLT